MWLSSLIRAAAIRKTTDSLLQATSLVVQRVQVEIATTSARVSGECMVTDDEVEIKDKLPVSSTDMPKTRVVKASRWPSLHRTATHLSLCYSCCGNRTHFCFILVDGVKLPMLACCPSS